MLALVLAALCFAPASAQAALVHPFLGSLTKPKPTAKKQPASTFSPAVCGTYVDPASGLLYVADMEAGVLIGNPSEEEFEEIPSIEVLKVSGTNATPVTRIAGKHTPEEELEEACDVVVNDKTGKVYVADKGGSAIYAFTTEGKFERSASIFNPIKGAGKKAGEGPGETLSEQVSVAVDEKTGAIYVGDGESEQVYKFSQSGAPEGKLIFPEGLHAPLALTVNQATGQIYAAVEKVEPEFTKEELAQDEESLDVFVFSPAGTFEKSIDGRRNGPFAGFGLEETEAITAIAVGPNGELYVADPFEHVVDEFNAEGTFKGALRGPPGEAFHEPTGVAVDASGKLYVSDRTEESNLATGKNLPGQVDVFGPAETGVPTVESTSVSDVAATTAQLHAEIDPTGAVNVTYFFEVCTGSPAICTDLPAAPGASVSGDAPVEVHQEATGLAANTPYTVRVVLHYGSGGEHETVGTTISFRTQLEGSTAALPDGRGWELVSPIKNAGASYEAIPKEGGVIQAAAGGNGLTYISTSPPDAQPEGNRNPAFNQLLAHRKPKTKTEPGEWTTSDITTAAERAIGVSAGNNQEYKMFSSELTQALVEPIEYTEKSEPPLAPNATEHTPYIRSEGTCRPSGCFEPLVTPEDDNTGIPFGVFQKNVKFRAATQDLTHVALVSSVPLTKEPAGASTSVYRWTSGAAASSRLQVVSVLPDGTPAADGLMPATYGPGIGARNAISKDGEHIVWSANNGSELFSRDMSANASVKLNEPEPGIAPSNGTPQFVAATPDGTKVFFTDAQKLTTDSTASGSKADLYEYDLTAKEPNKKIFDVAPDPSFGTNGEAADVQGVVLGINEEGETQGDTVYFVANGVLTETANAQGEKAAPGNCKGEVRPRSEEICNLYVSHFEVSGESGHWAAPQFIARLAETDRTDWTVQNSKLGDMTSRVSPNGRYLAFMSERSLTGYDNRDAAPSARGARDEEVFLYDSEAAEPAQALKCVSCNPSGARPHGVYDTEGAKEGLGLLIDRKEVWEQRWLAANIPGWTGYGGGPALYQSNYLNDQGRLYFNSADPLVAGISTPFREERVEGVNTQVGVSNVYEYEPSGSGSCAEAGGCVGLISSGTSPHESAFLDASTDGGNVFFLTSANLVLADEGTGLDVYDARVCGSEGCIVYPPHVEEKCASSTECHGGPPPAPTYSAPATSQPGTGNVSGQVLPNKEEKPKPVVKKPLTRAQKLKKALAACHKIKKKKKRQLCERTARKRYGPVKKKAKKAAKHATIAYRRAA